MRSAVILMLTAWMLWADGDAARPQQECDACYHEVKLLKTVVADQQRRIAALEKAQKGSDASCPDVNPFPELMPKEEPAR